MSQHLGCPPNVRRIGVINDDEADLAATVSLIESEFPLLTVRGFDSIFRAYQGVTTYDYLIIDVSSVAPLMLSDVSRAWAPIGKYAEEYPATKFIICSAMSRNAVNDVIDDCVEFGKITRERLTYGGFMWDCAIEPVDLKRTLHSLIKPEDMVWTKVRSKLKP